MKAVSLWRSAAYYCINRAPLGAAMNVFQHQALVTNVFVILSVSSYASHANETCTHKKVESKGEVCECPAGTIKKRSEPIPFATSRAQPTLFNCIDRPKAQPRQADAPPDKTQGSTDECSSQVLGQSLTCLSVEDTKDGGKRGYYITATCGGTYYAAVAVYNGNNACAREAVIVSAGNPTLVYSFHGHRPRILDAIKSGSIKKLNCYRAKHDRQPC